MGARVTFPAPCMENDGSALGVRLVCLHIYYAVFEINCSAFRHCGSTLWPAAVAM